MDPQLLIESRAVGTYPQDWQDWAQFVQLGFRQLAARSTLDAAQSVYDRLPLGLRNSRLHSNRCCGRPGATKLLRSAAARFCIITANSHAGPGCPSPRGTTKEAANCESHYQEAS